MQSVKASVPIPKQQAMENMGDLDMLLQPPMPSVKASKKPLAIKTRKPGKPMKSKGSINNKKNKNNNQPKTHHQAQATTTMACTDIRKAKICKGNPKCVYDYTEFKCKDKTASSKRLKTKKQSKQKSASIKTSKANVTKSILKQLQKSFSKIGDEARKDSNLLQRASLRL